MGTDTLAMDYPSMGHLLIGFMDVNPILSMHGLSFQVRTEGSGASVCSAICWSFLIIVCSFVGVPPLVSRRILEILTYLAKHKSLVARLLLYFEPTASHTGKVEDSALVNGKGKEKIDDEMMDASSGADLRGQIPLILLLKLLNQPLYYRSSAHLEQVHFDSCLS
jgi:hypothetical protein